MNAFDYLYSIEYDKALFSAAATRLAPFKKVKLLHGDSTVLLPEILDQLTGPALFWLDAHYSGGATGRSLLDSPIQSELRAIARHRTRGHVVLIDDAQDFRGADGYLTVTGVEEFSKSLDYSFRLEAGIMRLTPATSVRLS